MQLQAKQLISNIVLAMLFVLVLPVAIAQKATNVASPVAADPLEIKLVRSKVTSNKGTEVMESAAIAKPGEILEEVATYTSTSRSTLKNLEATLPVPRNTELILASVKPANARASIDGKTFSKLPLTRKVRNPSGVEVEVLVPVSEYLFLRWYPGEIAPNKPLVFSARFKVSDTPGPATSAAK